MNIKTLDADAILRRASFSQNGCTPDELKGFLLESGCEISPRCFRLWESFCALPAPMKKKSPEIKADIGTLRNMVPNEEDISFHFLREQTRRLDLFIPPFVLAKMLYHLIKVNKKHMEAGGECMSVIYRSILPNGKICVWGINSRRIFFEIGTETEKLHRELLQHIILDMPYIQREHSRKTCRSLANTAS